MKKRMATKSHERICLSVCLFVCLSICWSACQSVCLSVCLFFCLSVCLSVSKESWIVYVWKYLNLTWWTIWNLNQEGKKRLISKRHFPDSCSHFFPSQPATAKNCWQRKSQNKESVLSRSLTKNYLI